MAKAYDYNATEELLYLVKAGYPPVSFNERSSQDKIMRLLHVAELNANPKFHALRERFDVFACMPDKIGNAVYQYATKYQSQFTADFATQSEFWGYLKENYQQFKIFEEL